VVLCYESGVEQLPDEKLILERIRERLRTLPPGLLPPLSPRTPAPPDTAPEAIEVDLDALSKAEDVYDQPLRSQRRLLAPAVGLANRVARKLLKPSLERQVSYNAANERLVRVLVAQVEALRRTQAAVSERCDALQAEIAALRDAQRSG